MSSRSDAVVAVIPARGGSKGIPRKNLVRLGGRPLIAYTIEAAKRARLVDVVLVTTDSPEIARAARRLGAEIPFRRPRALAGDDVSVVEAARHAVRWLAEQGRKPEIVVLLQPTSPLRSAARIDEAVRLLRRRRADTVVGVREPETHPWQCVRFAKGRMRFAVPRPARRLNRQDYPLVHALNGALYAVRADVLLAGGLYGPRVEPLIMEAWESVDIDEPADLALAEHLLKSRRTRA
ncbi:MAG: acylneuraminate cytidylyltransferase family protein [Elusimicrobia bacterium]|nr:acylneuraminate cytidylyltransferase family protein [Elusimicrobiota bacterium]